MVLPVSSSRSVAATDDSASTKPQLEIKQEKTIDMGRMRKANRKKNQRLPNPIEQPMSILLRQSLNNKTEATICKRSGILIAGSDTHQQNPQPAQDRLKRYSTGFDYTAQPGIRHGHESAFYQPGNH